MNPRLDELLRQRQLMVEHLAWLDQEIGKVSWPSDQATQRPFPTPATYPAPRAQPEPEPAPPVIDEAAQDAAAEVAASIIDQYQEQNKKSLSSAKRGVYLIFAALIGTFIACVAAFYFFEKMRLGR